MYDAYARIDVVKKIPDITALSAHSSFDTVYVGLKNGSLLCFKHPNDAVRRGHECQVFREFEKKTVRDLQFVDSLELLISLAAGQVTVHSSKEPFEVVAVIDKYPLITAFAGYVHKKENTLFIAVSAKRQLRIFKLIRKEFEEIPINFNPATFLENPEVIRWCSSYSIYFASKTDYSFVQVFKDETTGLGTNIGLVQTFANRSPDAPIVSLPDRDIVGLVRSSVVEFFNADGMKVHNVPSAKFTDQPSCLVYDSPYLIAALPNNVIEIRSVVPPMVIQKIAIDKPMFLCNGPRGTVYVSGAGSIFELTSKPLLKDNIKNLLEDKQFDLAVQLTDLCDNMTTREKTEVKRKTAANLFAQKRFEECFRIHKEEKTDILLILHFFPALIPEKFRSKADQYLKETHDFLPCPDFTQNEWKQAEIELSDLLSEMRTEHAKVLEQHKQKTVVLSTSEFKYHENVLELADTVLLKCYLRTRPSFVPSLLRLSHNHCNVDEVAKDLYNAGRFDDLYLLYSKKNMRKKALDILKQQSRKEESMYSGPEETVRYLQTMGPANFDLVKEFSPWVLGESPELGVKIFASDDVDVIKQLNREQVLSFLIEECVPAVIPYLEHIIFKWKEDRQIFHEELVGMYINKVKRLMKDYVHALGENEMIPRRGAEEGELGVYGKKLINFLDYSTKYNPAAVEAQLGDEMMHEKAIVYGRLGRHEEALLIYANMLMDYDLAEKHCEKYYNEGQNSQIFVTLFKAYTNPSLLKSFSSMEKKVKHAPTKIAEALKLLTRHPTQLDPVEAIQLLPAQTPLQKVWPALEAVMEAIKNKATSIEIHLAVSQLALQKADGNLKKLKSEKVVIDYNVNCFICGKGIDSAFVRWKDGKLAHYSCHTKQNSSLAGSKADQGRPKPEMDMGYAKIGLVSFKCVKYYGFSLTKLQFLAACIANFVHEVASIPAEVKVPHRNPPGTEEFTEIATTEMPLCSKICTNSLYYCARLPDGTENCEMDTTMLAVVVISALFTGILLPLACISFYVCGIYKYVFTCFGSKRPEDVSLLERRDFDTFPSMQSTDSERALRPYPIERIYKKNPNRFSHSQVSWG
ncbi:hypothetical protein FO519_000058 [Halicephalobus sp. NKZ332]|nr:hypothetical protein FO519_000058 [Halicephalobus sp. NKZ332]